MRIRERALSSQVHEIKLSEYLITIKRIQPPLIIFVYSLETKQAVVLSGTGEKFSIEKSKLESLKKKAIAFAKANVTYDDGRSI